MASNVLKTLMFYALLLMVLMQIFTHLNCHYTVPLKGLSYEIDLENVDKS
jgi:hypothetical protein